MDAVIERIVDVIEMFMLQDDSDKFAEEGRFQMTAHVRGYVERNAKILFVLPAFPFKSPSSKKVLGTLPDFGEHYALFVLNSLCESIQGIYEPGARLTIVSDGSIYHDLVGVPRETYLAYQAEMRRMVQDFPCLDMKGTKDMLDEAEHTAWTTDKHAYLEERLANFDLDAELAENENLVKVYRGYLIFMEEDLETQLDMSTSRSQRRKVVRSVARQLLRRGHVFSGLVSRSFPEHIRLSIHCHDNRGPKFAVSVLPSPIGKTPWHNTVMLRGGRLEVVKASEASSSARVVFKNGRPWMLAEDDEDLNFTALAVAWDLVLPFGLTLTVDCVPLASIPQAQLRRLALKFGVVVVRGVQACADQAAFEEAVMPFGRTKGWFFGNVLTLKFNPEVDINNVLSKEAMPMHYDGLFKIDDSGKPQPPGFQYFFCKHAAGATLFTDTRMILPMFKPLEDKKWRVFTPKNSSFGGRPMELDLVEVHPETKDRIIRYHEPWGQEKTAFLPTNVDLLVDDSQRWNQRLVDSLYSRRFCLHHWWKDGDVVIADNISLMHTRLAYDDTMREIWRIHLD